MKRYVWAIALVLVAIIGIINGYRRDKSPMVSVVMLTYKRADVLPAAIESILAQSYPDFEFIIINDGSPDNTDEVMAKYTDKRIRYYKNEQNKGIAYSRNRAASLARGKYVMIMDDDDISLPERMKQQVEYLENHPEITVLAGQIIGFPHVPENHDDIAVWLIQYNNVGNANVMYRQSFALQHNIRYDEKQKASEDWDFWLKMLFNKAKFAAISNDVLKRNNISQKHYNASYEEANIAIRENIARFFNPTNPEAFYPADACGKIKMIAQKSILSEEYLQAILRANNCL